MAYLAAEVRRAAFVLLLACSLFLPVYYVLVRDDGGASRRSGRRSSPSGRAGRIPVPFEPQSGWNGADLEFSGQGSGALQELAINDIETWIDDYPASPGENGVGGAEPVVHVAAADDGGYDDPTPEEAGTRAPGDRGADGPAGREEFKPPAQDGGDWGETPGAGRPEPPQENSGSFGPEIVVDEQAAKLIEAAVQRIDDELALDRDIQTSLRVRKKRVDRSAETRKKRYTQRRQRGPDEPITIYFKDGWGFWGALGLDHPKFVEGCSSPCRATVDSSQLNTSEVVMMMEPSNTYKHVVRNEANNKCGVTAVVVLDPFFRAGWEPYLRGIDLLVSFSRHSDVTTTYAYGSQLDETVNSTTLSGELLRRGVLLAGGEAALPRDWSDKIGDTAMFVSNCGSRWRTEYIQELMKLVNVSSYGGCFHTPGLNGGRREDKVPIVSKHKVFLSFENTLMEDYLTEKFFEAALVPAVTIYFGPTNANAYFPSASSGDMPSIINGWDYRDPREMARLIRRLTTDFEFWKSHLRWKATPEASKGSAAALSEGYRGLHDNNFVATGRTSWICRTCEYYAENYDFEGWEGDSIESTVVDDGEDEQAYGNAR